VVQGYFAYHIFGLLWTNQFIIGFGYVVIAHCIGQYYWTRGLRADMTNFPVVSGMYVAARYHLGSIAFGSFIVAVIQFARLLLEYMDRKTKKMQQGNPATKWVMCCLRYCLWCGLSPCAFDTMFLHLRLPWSSQQLQGKSFASLSHLLLASVFRTCCP
jgi:hypothetical protein